MPKDNNIKQYMQVLTQNKIKIIFINYLDMSKTILTFVLSIWTARYSQRYRKVDSATSYR